MEDDFSYNGLDMEKPVLLFLKKRERRASNFPALRLKAGCGQVERNAFVEGGVGELEFSRPDASANREL